MPGDAVKSLISIHDVMPETMDETARILDMLRKLNVRSCQLLVVPGKEWQEKDLTALKAWQDEGWELVGHGWVHEARHIKGLYHRLHSLFVSRNVAEHLALAEEESVALMVRNHAWFAERGLTPPGLYVPPAWALGRLSAKARAGLPFRQIETLKGALDCASGRWQRQYLTGFEADTRLRAVLLRLFNRWNEKMAVWRGKPLRVAIHPHDLSYHLAEDIPALIARLEGPSVSTHTEGSLAVKGDVSG